MDWFDGVGVVAGVASLGWAVVDRLMERRRVLLERLGLSARSIDGGAAILTISFRGNVSGVIHHVEISARERGVLLSVKNADGIGRNLTTRLRPEPNNPNVLICEVRIEPISLAALTISVFETGGRLVVRKRVRRGSLALSENASRPPALFRRMKSKN
jgi:hypothetical protein